MSEQISVAEKMQKDLEHQLSRYKDLLRDQSQTATRMQTALEDPQRILKSGEYMKVASALKYAEGELKTLRYDYDRRVRELEDLQRSHKNMLSQYHVESSKRAELHSECAQLKRKIAVLEQSRPPTASRPQPPTRPAHLQAKEAKKQKKGGS